jgi:hypothetical protein
MGKFHEGALGGTQGAVGNLVFGNWKGIPTVRMKGRRTNRPLTEKQEIQKAKFRIASQFINSMTSLLKVTFADRARQMSGNNAAFAKVITEKITGVYPQLEIDYPRVMVALGSLNGAGQPTTAAATGNGILTYSWNDNSPVGNADASDLAILIAYSEELAATDYVIGPVTRSAGSATMNASRLLGKEVHTWLSFISSEKDIANSVYTGKLTVL